MNNRERKAVFRQSLISIRNYCFKVLSLFIILSFLIVLIFKFVPVPLTPLMLIRSTGSIFKNKIVGIDHDWVSLNEISPKVQAAVIKAEDYRFFEHNGFDYEAIEKALRYNKTHSNKKGASTITQQTAKNLFLWPSRSWLRKGFEAYFTLLIEAMWSKERIMEVYLNVIELGPGVYGVEAASQKYFKIKAKNLNSAQSALIAAVLPNPNRYHIEKPSSYVLSRQKKIRNRSTPKRKDSFMTSVF
jgi:monofunctional glycosyltransferase